MKNLKQNLALMLTLALLISFVPVTDVNAASAKLPLGVEEKLKDAIVLFLGSSKAIVNGQDANVDSTNPEVKPVMINSRTLVPVRFISEALGAKVDWDGSTSTITVSSDDKVIKLKLGNKSININGKNEALEVAAQSINNRSFIPLRALTNALGKQLFYDRGLIIISNVDKILDTTKDKAVIDEIIALFTGQVSENNNSNSLKSNNSAAANNTNKITNGRFAVQQGEWIYYVTRDKFTFKLYKMKDDGSDKTSLKNERTSGIVVAGDWIYFPHGADSNLYKIKTDGTDLTKLSDDKAQYISVYNGWIYYCNRSDEYKLYKIKTDGTQRTKVSDDDSSYITVAGDWVYYSTGSSHNSKIYRIKTDGTSKEIINENGVREFKVDGEWIYYIDTSNNRFYGDIAKMKLDGSQKTIITKTYAFDIRVSGDWVYYTQYDESKKSDDGGAIYKVKKDGSDKTLVVDATCRLEDITDNWIYYMIMQRIDGANIYSVLHRVKLDGSNAQEIGF
ncbi:hypothetical protein HNQ80_002665 [Anaerosolibacter carboniphilus]|uniref:DUF5050 domain-containing protein n=1 Tax=Anaerosolibacter carboniphilus TaxID=1417629 RepID=A0A841KT41_9FIRM|nr:DUF5050 domain-containing protein [Anaerosolibacter carboniphilus]MBB6216563.1 hypothetical protein [Anaerosolibacter carboniphilus]